MMHSHESLLRSGYQVEIEVDDTTRVRAIESEGGYAIWLDTDGVESDHEGAYSADEAVRVMGELADTARVRTLTDAWDPEQGVDAFWSAYYDEAAA